MDTVIGIFGIIGIFILTIMVTVISVAIAVIIFMTLWALVRPHISSVIDKRWSWFHERTE